MPPQTPDAPPRPSVADPLLGTVLHGKFRVDQALGKGGAGKVYVATQLSLGRPVALKVLRDDVNIEGDERFVERFYREAALAGALSHPNVVTVHDYGRTDEGICYIAMELLDGRSLKQILRDGPMELERALDLFEQVVRGLRHAHRAGLV
ncbi:MAG: serine/threonine-protein kinase, partial [bacterium]